MKPDHAHPGIDVTSAHPPLPPRGEATHMDMQKDNACDAHRADGTYGTAMASLCQHGGGTVADDECLRARIPQHRAPGE